MSAEVEERPLTPALRRGLAILLSEHNRQVTEHLDEIAADLGAPASDGWQFDMQRGAFVRALHAETPEQEAAK